MRNRIQAYDSPFSLYRTDGSDAAQGGRADEDPVAGGCVRSSTTATNTYYDEVNPLAGVKITDTNTKIEIVKEAADGSTISVKVGPAVK